MLAYAVAQHKDRPDQVSDAYQGFGPGRDEYTKERRGSDAAYESSDCIEDGNRKGANLERKYFADGEVSSTGCRRSDKKDDGEADAQAARSQTPMDERSPAAIDADQPNGVPQI